MASQNLPLDVKFSLPSLPCCHPSISPTPGPKSILFLIFFMYLLVEMVFPLFITFLYKQLHINLYQLKSQC